MIERFTRLPRVREVWSSNLGPAKSCTALQTVRHRFNIYASSSVAFGAMTRRWTPQTRYTLRRYITSIMKGLFFVFL